MLDLVVLGCPRSGTRWLTSFLQQSGIDAGHERMPGDTKGGRVPRAIVRPSTWTHLESRRWLHLVRHPLPAIRSLMDLPAKHVRPTAQLCGVKDEPEDRPVPLPNGHALAPRDPELYARYWLLQHQAIEWWMAPMHISKWVQARIEHQAEVEWVASWAGGNPPAEPDFTALEESRTAHYPARHHEVQWSDLGAIRSVVEDRAAAYGYEEKPPPPRW